MNKIVIYDFTIKAVSPLHLGAGQEGQENKLVKNAQEKPVLPGNSLGGALREYLKQTEAPEETVRKYMGGAKLDEDRQEIFVTSGVYISDGKIAGDIISRKEGTAVNPAYGVAERHSKYSLEYLPEGTEISFRIEGDVRDGREQCGAQGEERLCAAELEKIIGTWARGFATLTLVLGGQKSNGFGRCELKKLEKTVFPLDNSRSMDEYIFQRKGLRERRREELAWQDLAYYFLTKRSTLLFSMRGEFPYGVYQAFPIKEAGNTNTDPTGESPGRQQLTGLLQKGNDYFIPSTSLKGVLKNEIRLLLKKMTGEKLVDAKLVDLFCGKKNQGRLVFSDLRIADGKPVEVERYLKNKQGVWETEKGQPVYIKIDRLTGGAFASALKHQQEIQGSAEIRFELMTEPSSWENNPYVFPLVYALRRIGAGTVPLGGRTVIGLGQFSAPKVNVVLDNKTCAIETESDLSSENRKLLEHWFESFKRWCNDENTSAL